MLCADGFSTDLAEEIDLNGCIYGYHVIVLADDLGIVYIVNRQDLDRRVIIDIVVDPLGAVSKGGNALAAVDLLFGVVDGAALDKLDHGVGEHFGMYAEIVLGFERHAGRVGNCTDAELDACTVGDLLCYEVADGLADLVDSDGRQNRQLVIILNDSIYLRNMQLGAAQASGLILVYFDENSLRLVYHRFGVRAVEREAEVAVAVHGRDLDAERIVLILSADVARNIAIVGRQKICPAAVYRLARIAGAEP